MSLRENEISRAQRAQHSHQKKQKRNKHREKERRVAAALFSNDDSRVLSFKQWCLLNDISPRTGRRILASGNGPVITQLSQHRIGISVGNNRRWQASRERGAKA